MGVTILAVIGGAVTVGGGIALVVSIWKRLTLAYRRTIGSRRDLRRRLDELACGTTREYVEQRLGPPAMRRDVKASSLVEYVYRTRHALIQVLYDDADALAVLSLTIDDPKFRFNDAGDGSKAPVLDFAEDSLSDNDPQ